MFFNVTMRFHRLNTSLSVCFQIICNRCSAKGSFWTAASQHTYINTCSSVVRKARRFPILSEHLAAASNPLIT